MWNPFAFAFNKLNRACWGVPEPPPEPVVVEGFDPEAAKEEVSRLKTVISTQYALLKAGNDAPGGLKPMVLLQAHVQLAELRERMEKLPNALYHYRKAKDMPMRVTGHPAWEAIAGNEAVKRLLEHARTKFGMLQPEVFKMSGGVVSTAATDGSAHSRPPGSEDGGSVVSDGRSSLGR